MNSTARFALTIILCCGVLSAQAGKPLIGVYTNGKSIEKTEAIFKSGGFDVQVVIPDSMEDFCGNSKNVLVIGENEILHHSVRQTVDKFLQNAGSIIIMNPDAMNYQRYTVTLPVEIAERQTLFDLDGDEKTYKIDIATKSTITSRICESKNKGNAMRLETKGEIGGSAFIEMPIKLNAEPTRFAIEIAAKGDIQFDIITAVLKDNSGNGWIGFCEMSDDWDTYIIAISDMLPEKAGGKKLSEISYSDISSIRIGLDNRVIWGEAGGTVIIDKINLIRYNTNRYPYSGEVVKYQTQYASTGADYPQWLFDLTGKTQTISAPQAAAKGQTISLSSPATAFDTAFARPGGNIQNYLDAAKTFAARHIPLIEAGGKHIARINLYIDGRYQGATAALIGVNPADYDKRQVRDIICQAAQYMGSSAKILDLVPDTKPSADGKGVDFAGKAVVYNPSDEPADCRIELSIAGGALKSGANVTLAPNAATDVMLNCGAVGEDFPFAKFSFELSLAGQNTADVISEQIEIEGTLKEAADRLIAMQDVNFADWAYTHWFYSDSYAARMLRAFGEYTSNRNYTNSGMRWAAMIAAAQTETGAYPMGYGMKKGIYYIADNGSIALALAQTASFAGDMERAALCESLRKAFEWRKSYKVTPQRAAELEAQYGKDAKGTKVGNYGVGIVNQDHVTDTGMYETAKPEYRGVWYTMACTMGFPAALAKLTGQQEYIDAAKADARMYLDNALTATDSYAPEGLIWLYEYIDDPQMKEELKTLITDKFISYFPKAAERFWLYGGSRQTLLICALAHCMHNIENSQRTRAAVLESVIGLCGTYSPYSMLRLSGDYPKATYSKANNEGTMYLSFGSFGLMEILEPGSTMLKRDDCK